MIGQIFLKVMNMSMTATYCIAVVLLLRTLMQKLPKIYSYVLWAAVYFRLVCPVSLQSAFSLVKMKTEPVPQKTSTQLLPQMSAGTVVSNPVWERALHGSTTPEHTVYRMDLMQIVVSAAGIVWILVFFFALAYSVWSYIRLKMQLSGAVLLEKGVYEKEGIKTPFVIGLFRPNIYLPPDMEKQEKKFVLEHERTHIKRRDYFIKQLAFLITCVYWFHPLVWLSFYLMCKDMEMSCDECVIRKLGKEMRKEYSAVLLSMSCGRKVVLGSPLAFGENNIRSRIMNVLRYKKRAVWASAAMTVIVAAVIAGLMLNPQQSGQKNASPVDRKQAAQDKTDVISDAPDYKKNAAKLKNIVIASGTMTLSNSTEATVELCMKKGIFYEDTVDGFEPSIYTYSSNYEGNYVLRTKNEKGEIVYESSLENYAPDMGFYYEGNEAFNYPGQFSIEWTDYNKDGCPDFTIGMPLSSNNMGFLLLTVREDGTIDRLCEEIIAYTHGEFSLIFDHDIQAKRMPIMAEFYDNTIGEMRPVTYVYQVQKGMYVREEDKVGAVDTQLKMPFAADEQQLNIEVKADTKAEEGIGRLQRYEDYEGYLDEAPGQSKYIYEKLDLDQDGKIDRVYRYREANTALFEIRFGNGDKLFLGEFEKSYVFPSLSAAMIEAVKVPVILFTCHDIVDNSGEKMKIALYTKLGNQYEKIERLPGADAGPYLDGEEMRAGYYFEETYDSKTNKMQITFANTDQRLEVTPEGEMDDDFYWQNDTAYTAQLLTYQGETGIVFCEKAYGKSQWDDFCYVLAIRLSERSDRNPYNLDLVFAGWTDELEKEVK